MKSISLIWLADSSRIFGRSQLCAWFPSLGGENRLPCTVLSKRKANYSERRRFCSLKLFFPAFRPKGILEYRPRHSHLPVLFDTDLLIASLQISRLDWLLQSRLGPLLPRACQTKNSRNYEMTERFSILTPVDIELLVKLPFQHALLIWTYLF